MGDNINRCKLAVCDSRDAYGHWGDIALDQESEATSAHIAALESLCAAYEGEPTYDQGVAAGFDEAIGEVKRGEINPQTYQRKPTA
jgi:hypothetical protein